MQKPRLLKAISSNRYFLIPFISALFFIIFYFVYRDVKATTIDEFNNEQLILARTASQGITSFFDDCHSDLSFLSKLDDIVDGTDKSDEILKKYFDTHDEVLAAVTRIDPNGYILSTFPYNASVIGEDISYQKHFQRILTTHQPVISDVFMSVQGFLSIAYHIPVFKNNKFDGSIAVLIPINKLGEIYLESIKSRGTGLAWLLTENGIEIYCPIAEHAGNTFLDNTMHDLSATELLEKIKIAESGTLKSVHLQTSTKARSKFNEEYITFYRTPLGNTYWTIFISCQEKDIYNSLTRFRNHSVIVFTLLFIAIAFYFFSLAKVRNVLTEEAKRKKAEKTLQKSEEKFRKIFEDHSAIKIVIDPENGAIIDANNSAGKFYGWTREELKKINIGQINTLSFKELHKEIDKLLHKGKKHFEFQHVLKDGKIRDVEVFSSKIEIDNKTLLHSIIQDITKRKNFEKALLIAKEQAEESNRLKTAFLQNMSHEIRTPLNAIIGFSALLEESFDNKEQLKHFSEIITLSSNNLLKIITDILDAAKIESGQLNLNYESFKLNELLSELNVFFSHHKKHIQKQHIEFTLSPLSSSIDDIITTDKGKLRQILINLISNAFKFTEEGKIEGNCKIENTQDLLFSITDTGVGIPTNKQTEIFERFTQLSHDMNPVSGGTGLGLSIVSGLVKLLGGKIWLTSETQNISGLKQRGTTFYFSIPINKTL